MAASLRKVRYDCFFRHFNDSGRYLRQGFVTRNTLSTSAFHSYSKSLPLMTKKGNESGTTPGFTKPRSLPPSFRRDAVGPKSHSKDSTYKRGEKELDSDPETESEDEEDLSDKSSKSKKESRKGGKSRKWKSQKSAENITLRPSKYLFKDFLPGQEEEKRWERRYASEDRKGKVNWYARQMLRLTREGKVVRQCAAVRNIHIHPKKGHWKYRGGSYIAEFLEERTKLYWNFLGKVDEALNLLASMKKNELHPRVEIYNIFISAYAKRGQVRKAFKMFNDVKKKGLKPTAHTFSSLFNACTKASTPQHALHRVEKLLAEISKRTANQELEMNVITYNAAIQALVICGDPLQAFDIYQEMQDNRVEPDGHTFSSLLTACSFDKVEGPGTAFKLLEEMKALQIQPDIYIFNSVLKVMRDFKVSTEGQKARLLKSMPSADVTEVSSSEHVPRYAHDEESSEGESSELNSVNNSLQEGTNHANENDNDLQLHHYFPGVEKFIQMMAVENVSPDVRTFQLLLYMMSSKDEEDYLMELMKSCNISPDVTFYNTLIKKKAIEEGLLEAKVYMQELKETLKIFPPERSYHALAHGCKRQKQGLALLDEMKSEGIAADQSVYGILIAGAAKERQFSYLTQLVKRMTDDDVQPNDRMMEVLERAYNLPCNKPVIARTMDDRLVKLRKFRFVEQRGFQTFFENWKAKNLARETAMREPGKSSHIEQYDNDTLDETRDDDVSDDETSDDDEDSKFSHL